MLMILINEILLVIFFLFMIVISYYIGVVTGKKFSFDHKQMGLIDMKQKNQHTIHCPHCGKRITLELIIKVDTILKKIEVLYNTEKP